MQLELYAMVTESTTDTILRAQAIHRCEDGQIVPWETEGPVVEGPHLDGLGRFHRTLIRSSVPATYAPYNAVVRLDFPTREGIRQYDFLVQLAPPPSCQADR